AAQGGTGQPARDDAGPLRARQLPRAQGWSGCVRNLRLRGHAGPAARRYAGRPQHLEDPADAGTYLGRGGTQGDREMTPTYYVVLAAILFTIGAVGVLIRRNAIVLFMCVELMLNAANLALVTFSRINGGLDGQIMAFFVMVVAAAEVVVGLA